MERRIVFTGKNEVSLETFIAGAVGEKQVKVRTLYSMISTGTESIVLQRRFEAGSHFDGWVQYPFYPGYLVAGTVEELGAEVKLFKKGDLVVCRCKHSSCNIAEEADCISIDSNIDIKMAPWFGLAKIAAMGARAAGYTLGTSVLVIGAGPIGQMTVRWAAAAGCEKVIVVDTQVKRLALALSGGATGVVSKPVNEAVEEIKALNNGNLPSIVVDTTGNANVFSSALEVCADFGKVVILGDTGTPTSQCLTKDVITRGLHIVGAHDIHDDAHWNLNNITRLFFSLVQRGRFNLDGLNTHYFSPEQYREAYNIVETNRGETMGIIFDWSK